MKDARLSLWQAPKGEIRCHLIRCFAGFLYFYGFTHMVKNDDDHQLERSDYGAD